jgi:hypothetical protein
LGDARYGIDLHLDPTPLDRLHGGAHPFRPRKELRVNGIKAVETADIAQVVRTLHHIIERAAPGLEHFTDVRQSKLGLVFDAALDDISCFKSSGPWPLM